MNIGTVAKQAGLNTSTIRYYESIGLLPTVDRQNGRRIYSQNIFEQLQLIKVSKQAGFSLNEIKSLLNIDLYGGHMATQWRVQAEQKLQELDALIAQAEKMKTIIQQGLLCNCAELHECDLLAT